MTRPLIATLLTAALAAGCGETSDKFASPQRLSCGLVILLPGIEGEGPLSYSIRDGLSRAGIDSALRIYQWGRPVPVAGLLLNQMDVLGNRAAARRVARLIVDYQESHPDHPVYMVGHSGGGGVAVFAAEALPPHRQVEGLILLAPSISSGYDLSRALDRCRKGIVNFHSAGDAGFLIVGTTLFGNVDGVRSPAAGAVGFAKHRPRLFQKPWTTEMALAGNLGGHLGSTTPEFQRYVAPWLKAQPWPVTGPATAAAAAP